ncbi:MFS transporter [Brevibacterium litoralis]|uniref:MFS transporter n=1 Tax=Brevibacterium litoralis TaxID=3138935 RepID=UPI0032EDE932
MTTSRPPLRLERRHWLLAAAQMFAGIGTAVGFAVGALLAEDLTGSTRFAGFAQTASVLGAGLAAVPLARLAARRGRRASLTLGFALAALGAAVVVGSSTAHLWPGYFLGMALVGVGTATGLQARFAATDGAPTVTQGRLMSFVVWAQTVGSVLGPMLSEPGAALGHLLGVHPLVGPFVVTTAAFGLAVLCTAVLPGRRALPSPAAQPTPTAGRGVGIGEAIRTVFASPTALLGFTAVVTGHMIMASVMVMTPLHMHHSGHTIGLVGIVISVHTLGMYAFSPLVGWLADRWGPGRVVGLGCLVFVAAIGLGLWDSLAHASSLPRISASLFLLGLAWSCTLLAGSTLTSQGVPDSHRTTVQGVTDASMNYGAAIVTAAGGPLLAAGGFLWINLMAAAVLVLLIAAGVHAGFGTRR